MKRPTFFFLKHRDIKYQEAFHILGMCPSFQPEKLISISKNPLNKDSTAADKTTR